MVSDGDVGVSRVESISVSSFFGDTLTGYLSQTVLQGIPLAVRVLELLGEHIFVRETMETDR